VSEENVEISRRVTDAFNRWDLDAAAQDVDHLINPDIEFVNPPYAVEPGVRRGRTTFYKILGEMNEIYRDWRFEPERFVDAGEHVVVIGWVQGARRPEVSIRSGVRASCGRSVMVRRFAFAGSINPAKP
jgi:ketosteroid isomerase-like protein